MISKFRLLSLVGWRLSGDRVWRSKDHNIIIVRRGIIYVSATVPIVVAGNNEIKCVVERNNLKEKHFYPYHSMKQSCRSG